jgi:hypothetical protein
MSKWPKQISLMHSISVFGFQASVGTAKNVSGHFGNPFGGCYEIQNGKLQKLGDS